MAERTSSCETIAAIATPPGRGGIGIVRVSGPDALALVRPLLRRRRGGAEIADRSEDFERSEDASRSEDAQRSGLTDRPNQSGSTANLHSPPALEPGRARYLELCDPVSGERLDEAIVTYFAGPRSYTGEDVVEIAAHGSPVVLELMLRRLVEHGARLANPGEFTERAFLAGRLDLTQAEAVRDLIEAQTLYQARVAASQLDGALSRRVTPVKTALVALIAQLEAGIDFSEDDTPVLSGGQIRALAAPIAQGLAALEHSFEHGRLVHSGLTLAIVGEPNVGKSSLFNRLVERERAIVTASPGTTRDPVTERVSIAGIPVELVDTAGLREALDEAERIGIAKSREALADSDLVLVVLDASAQSPGLLGQVEDDGSLLRLLDGRRAIVVRNKCDLPAAQSAERLTGAEAAVAWQQRLGSLGGVGWQTEVVRTSARTGEGVEALRAAIARQVQTDAGAEQDGMVTNLRQHQAIVAASASVTSAVAAADLPHEMLLLDLYAALGSLDALTGETTPDDVLNLIFSTFCIGK